MAGSFCLGSKILTVSNHRFCSMLEWALNQANQYPNTEYIDRFKSLSENKWIPCTDLNIEKDLSKDEALYWCKVFENVAQKIFLRELGNIDKNDWQTSYIHDTLALSKILSEYGFKKNIL